LNGTPGADTINGFAGFDNINGNGGDDTIFGGDDNDNLNGGVGNDTIDGGAGADFITGGDGNNTLLGGDGNDNISQGGNTGHGLIDGGAGNDTITGGFASAGLDTLLGGSGDDTISGIDAGDIVDGGAGNDIFRVNANSFAAAPIVLTMSADRDTVAVQFFNSPPLPGSPAPAAGVIVNGFDAAGGEVLDVNSILSNGPLGLTGWDGSTNPFSTGAGGGFFRLHQDGADVVFDVDNNGSGDNFIPVVRFTNVDVNTFTAANFTPGYDWHV
jgi:Ca2+-binding RTX toxin-like protein